MGLVGVVSAALLVFGYVLQYFLGLTPCPLCIAQRFFYLVIAVTGIGLFFTRKEAGTFGLWPGLVLSSASLIGGSIAARQVWLQNFAPDLDPTKCGTAFGPLLYNILVALGGQGNCVLVEWTFLTFSIAEWSLFWFVILGAASFYLLFRKGASD